MRNEDNHPPAPLATDALILQVLKQLQQQQLVTNELLRNQQQSNEQQRAFIQQQENVLRNIQVQVPPNPEAILDSLASNVKEFRYDAENNITFSTWFSRYEELFANDAARLDEQAKVRLLMRKLGIAEHERYCSFILPKTTKDFTFDATVTKLKGLFGAAESLISKRYRCLQTAKSLTEDFITYTCRINKTCVEFELLSSECQRLLNLRHDTAMIETSNIAVNAIKQRFHKPTRAWKNTSSTSSSSSCSEKAKKVPPSPCWKCGSMHYLDSASDITVISSGTWKQLGEPPTRYPSVNAKTASGDSLQLLSEFECSITIDEVTQVSTIYVVEQDLHILGLDLVEKFQLDAVPMNVYCRQVNNSTPIVERLKAAYPQVFSISLGRCTKTTVKLDLKPGQRPVICPKRSVVYAMYQAIDEDLDRLERLKIITPIDYSDWAALISDCGRLNDALQPHQYPLPLPQDIFVKLSNCTVFSIIDMSESYLQVDVDDSTSTLLTINTHRGLYKVNRLAPGVKAAPGAFQQLVDTMLAGLKQTCGYIDDVIVGGENEEEHWHNLNALFQRLQEFGFTVRLEKCSFGRKQIKYLAHMLDQHGIRPDPAKVEAIKLMPAPTNVSEVRSFLGAVNYYGKFVPNMRALRSPMDDLLKTGAKFVWTSQCQRAFDEFKTILSSDLLLTHYNPKLDIIVSADASSVGLGATISHCLPDGSITVVQQA
ncbi:uncharacterized protein K02A2.6-like [Armigeres subalbatus]|uniref:uncharacterized protein K02A2.6-like n=1 Tax=Armigeres subalbatus TaxID=124917 RepID=UPI002ED5FB7A